MSLALAGGVFTSEPPGKPCIWDFLRSLTIIDICFNFIVVKNILHKLNSSNFLDWFYSLAYGLSGERYSAFEKDIILLLLDGVLFSNAV